MSSGCSVQLPIVNIKPSISGRFNSPIDNFDSTRHAVNVKVTPGEMLNSSITNLQVSRYDSVERAPVLKQFVNCFTGNSTEYNAGFIDKLIGNELKLDSTKTDEGLFLVNIESGSEVKVQHFGKITNAELMFTLPVLTKGEYVSTGAQGLLLRQGDQKECLQKDVYDRIAFLFPIECPGLGWGILFSLLKQN
nr:DNA-binding domain-containing protein [uncultured Acetobacteroides sp.]